MTSPAPFERSVAAELARRRGDSPLAGGVRQLRARDRRAARVRQLVVAAVAVDRGSLESARTDSRRSLAALPPVEEHAQGERSAGAVVKCVACDLEIVSRTAALAPRYCPRCLAYRHVAVGLEPFPTGVG